MSCRWRQKRDKKRSSGEWSQGHPADKNGVRCIFYTQTVRCHEVPLSGVGRTHRRFVRTSDSLCLTRRTRVRAKLFGFYFQLGASSGGSLVTNHTRSYQSDRIHPASARWSDEWMPGRRRTGRRGRPAPTTDHCPVCLPQYLTSAPHYMLSLSVYVCLRVCGAWRRLGTQTYRIQSNASIQFIYQHSLYRSASQ